MTSRCFHCWLLMGLSCLTVCIASPAVAQSSAAERTIQAHAEFLASDGLEGRATGSRGYELAAAYVAGQFRQLGLQPLSARQGYLQAVPLVEATVVLPGSAMSYKRDNATLNLEFGKDYLPTANFFNSNISSTAPLVFVGFGVDAPEYQYNDFANVDVQGRIAVVLAGAPARFKPAERAYYGWRDTKYAQLIKLGALGVIEVMYAPQSTPENLHSNWERAVSASWITEMRDLRDDEQPNEPFPELKLKFRLSSDAAVRLFAGAGTSYEQVLQNAQDGVPQGLVLPGSLALSATTGLRRVDSNNVVGVVRGSDPALRNEYVLITAHLDHLGRGPAVAGDNIYNGMQHNAAGVAMLLEIARSLTASAALPKRSIVFAVVTAGDKQGQGLRHLLNGALLKPSKVVAAVALDTPLPLARTLDVDAPGARDSSMGVILSTVLAAQGKVLSGSDMNALLDSATSPLLHAGIPTVMIRSGERAVSRRVDLPAMKRQWQKTHLDQPSDDAQSMPLDARAASELTAVSGALVRQLADGKPPTWYRSSFMMRKLRAARATEQAARPD